MLLKLYVVIDINLIYCVCVSVINGQVRVLYTIFENFQTAARPLKVSVCLVCSPVVGVTSAA